MATGSLDANGIWLYGEDDSEPTASALLNKLGNSISDKFDGGLPVANGGTGATTVAGAQDSLRVGLVPISPTSLEKAGAGSTASANTLGQVTFSNCTSLSLNGVFSSAYEYYKLVARLYGSVVSDGIFTFRKAGTNTTTGYYGLAWQRAYDNSTGAFFNQNNGGNGSFSYISNSAAAASFFTADVLVNSQVSAYQGQSWGTPWLMQMGYHTSAVTSHDGFTITPLSGSITGTIQVFGYNN